MNQAKKCIIFSVTPIADQTVEVVIKVPIDFDFRAGQYIWLMIPELKYPDLRGNTRMFSIVSSPTDKGKLSIIFRISESGFKKTLIEMAPGTEIVFSGPYGPLKLPEDNSTPIVFVAGGVGIAPLLSMIRFSSETASGHHITLIYANTNEAKTAYLNELEQIEKSNPNFKLVKVFGQLEAKSLEQFISPQTTWFVIGPRAFVESAGNILIQKKVASENIFFEEFHPLAAPESEFEKELKTTSISAIDHPYLVALENASNHIVITDINGIIIYANKGAQNMTGYSRDELIGNTPRLWGGLMPEDFYKNLWKTIKYDKQVFTGEIKNRRKNQEEYWAFARISPIVDTKDTLTGFVASEEDITAIKEIDIAKTEFISIASHQLKTPVAGLSWVTEALDLTSKNMTVQQKGYIKDLATLAQRLSELIEDLLNLSRIEIKSSVITEKQPVEFIEYIEKFVKEIGLYAVTKQHSIIFNNKITGPLMIELNKKALYNVLQNLTSNAINYSPENTAVTINLDQEKDFVKILISNKGPTIPEEEKMHLFTKFYRGESAKKLKSEGTGLGLYICKKILEEMGGSIGFESEKGKDTVFWFTVPIKQTN